MESKPELFPYLQVVWQGFCELNRARSSGFDVCPLSVQEIVAWLQLYEITGSLARDWFELIKGLDAYYLKLVREKHGSTTKSRDRRQSSQNRGS